jgi:hypothetical protein
MTSPGYIGTKMVMAIPKEVLDSKTIPQIPMGRLGADQQLRALLQLVCQRRQHQHSSGTAVAAAVASAWRAVSRLTDAANSASFCCLSIDNVAARNSQRAPGDLHLVSFANRGSEARKANKSATNVTGIRVF